ncbi:MAG: S-layer homology domain-containing protein, partial [Firmicutes bacterium]|nr:S-layer homology domain-containing protein [Bacillota bacterium]
QEEFIKTVVCLICGELNESNAPTVKNTWNSKWSSWAIPYLDKAFELGLITEQDTMFKLVGIPCNRGEMAKVITRAVEYLKEDSVADTSTYITKLKDYNRMKEEYKPYVLQAYAKGILSGYDDGTFRDDGLLTRAEASSVLVRLIDKNERVNSDETLYDYFGRKVTWTEPLRTDVPEQYQVSISDHDVISQANYNESVQLGGTPSDYCLSRSKAMMFEDLVLQSIRYDSDTITLIVPDYLPESQKWTIGITYWDIDKDYDFTMMKSHYIDKPGTYEFNDIKVLEGITIREYGLDSSMFQSGIYISNGVSLSLERKEQPTVEFNNLRGTTNKITGLDKEFVWVQGQGYKDYIKDYQFDESDIELNW